jgi:RimJ/RimL family protein N-acetyltransferase
VTHPPTPAGSPEGSSTAAVTVRRLEWRDFEPLIDAYYALYDEREENDEIGIPLFGERPSPDSEVAWFAKLYADVLRGDTIDVVAELNGRAVGHCTIAQVGPAGNGFEKSHVGVLGILVDRRFRGRGAGTALLVRALEEARGRFERVRLGVFASNPRARALYERLGFRLVGRLPGETKRGDKYIDEDLMALDLKDWHAPGAPANR